MEQIPPPPGWGALIKASLKDLREIFASFGEEFVFRTNDGWAAAFCMEPGNDLDNEAAERLCSHGYVPIYLFDFCKDEFLTSRWDGERWNLDRHPSLVLGAVGIRAPYSDEAPVAKPESLETREAIVIEGVTVEQARTIAGDRLRIEPGPRGAIVYQPDLDTRFGFWDHAPGHVLEVLFYPNSGEFWYRVMKGEECLGTFRPGETRTWDGTPFLDSVEGETKLEAIVEKLGIPRSFVERLK